MKDCASATALVLAGGKSNRMKTNKALIPLQGFPLIERVLVQLNSQFSEIFLCVSSNRQYDFLDFPQVVDDQPFQGPLVAMLSGLRASKNSINFVIACDIPEINPKFLKQMFEFSKSYDIVVPWTGQDRYEPLFAFYNKNTIPVIENILNEGHGKLSLLFPRCHTCFVRMNDKSWYFNLNTLEDLKQYSHYVARRIRRQSRTKDHQINAQSQETSFFWENEEIVHF